MVVDAHHNYPLKIREKVNAINLSNAIHLLLRLSEKENEQCHNTSNKNEIKQIFNDFKDVTFMKDSRLRKEIISETVDEMNDYCLNYLRKNRENLENTTKYNLTSKLTDYYKFLKDYYIYSQAVYKGYRGLGENLKHLETKDGIVSRFIKSESPKWYYKLNKFSFRWENKLNNIYCWDLDTLHQQRHNKVIKIPIFDNKYVCSEFFASNRSGFSKSKILRYFEDVVRNDKEIDIDPKLEFKDFFIDTSELISYVDLCISTEIPNLRNSRYFEDEINDVIGKKIGITRLYYCHQEKYKSKKYGGIEIHHIIRPKYIWNSFIEEALVDLSKNGIWIDPKYRMQIWYKNTKDQNNKRNYIVFYYKGHEEISQILGTNTWIAGRNIDEFFEINARSRQNDNNWIGLEIRYGPNYREIIFNALKDWNKKTGINFEDIILCTQDGWDRMIYSKSLSIGNYKLSHDEILEIARNSYKKIMDQDIFRTYLYEFYLYYYLASNIERKSIHSAISFFHKFYAVDNFKTSLEGVKDLVRLSGDIGKDFLDDISINDSKIVENKWILKLERIAINKKGDLEANLYNWFLSLIRSGNYDKFKKFKRGDINKNSKNMREIYKIYEKNSFFDDIILLEDIFQKIGIIKEKNT